MFILQFPQIVAYLSCCHMREGEGVRGKQLPKEWEGGKDYPLAPGAALGWGTWARGNSPEMEAPRTWASAPQPSMGNSRGLGVCTGQPIEDGALQLGLQLQTGRQAVVPLGSVQASSCLSQLKT